MTAMSGMEKTKEKSRQVKKEREEGYNEF